ncbi:MAG: ABC transporter permease [Opitutales bacterium]
MAMDAMNRREKEGTPEMITEEPKEGVASRRTGYPPREAEEAARRCIAAKDAAACGEWGWRGTWVLFRRELTRFMKVAGQSIGSPVLTTMLYFVVFGYSLGARLDEIRGIPYIDFLVPGLIMLNLITNAFLNSAFSLFIIKIHGALVDILLTPLTPLQIVLAYTSASLVRAMLTGGIIWAVAAAMGAGTIHNVAFTLVFMVLTAVGFALLGLVVAILAEDFDHVNLIPSFLLMPLTFLGGVFYSIEMLPEPWSTISQFNPILYMVNGLRYGMTGVSDVPVWQGLFLVSAVVLLCGVLAVRLLASGKKLRE